MKVELVQEIVERARRQGLSKGELAQRAGPTQPALSRLLSGANGARLDTVERLASAVGMRLALVPDDDFAADLLSGRILDFSSGGRSRT